MKKSNKSTLIKTAAAGAVLIATSAVASAQNNECNTFRNNKLPNFSQSNIEYHALPANKDLARVNLFYDLPAGITGYSFLELYGNEGYFEKNMIHIPLESLTGIKAPGLGFAVNSKHFKNQDLSSNKVGIGIEQKMNFSETFFASAKLLPLWYDKDGRMKNEAVMGYFVSKTFPVNKKLDFNLSAFGEFNVASKRTSQWGYLAEWNYGEVDASALIKTKAGQFDVGVGFNQIPYTQAHPDDGSIFTPAPTEKFLPVNQFRFKFAYHPRVKKDHLVHIQSKGHYGRKYVPKQTYFKLK